jgi:hypothetical protein
VGSTQVIKLMTVGDVCRLLNKSRATIEYYLRYPERAPVPFPLPAQVIGENRYWDRKAVRKWRENYKQYRAIMNTRYHGKEHGIQIREVPS